MTSVIQLETKKLLEINPQEKTEKNKALLSKSSKRNKQYHKDFGKALPWNIPVSSIAK